MLGPGECSRLKRCFVLRRISAGKTVLDVGCGDGLNSDVLGLLGARVTGIDISSGAVQLAGERCSVSRTGERQEHGRSPAL